MAGTVVYDAGASGRISAADGAEADFKYQGTLSTSVKSAAGGPTITGTSANYSTSPVKVWIAKALVTNKDVLSGNGIVLRIGSTSANYYYYNSTFTATTYPIVGGWQIVPIDPNINGYGRLATGSPNLAAVTWYQVYATLSATSKSENIAIDAVDYVSHGSGLTVTGSGSLFSDFVLFDEGTSTNRYGLVLTKQGIIYTVGVLTIGTSTLTTMTDSNVVMVFPDGRFNTGFSGLKFGLENASNVLALSGCTFIGKGGLGGLGGNGGSGVDTRPVLSISGTSGTLSLTGCSFQSFNTIVLNSKVTVDGCSFVNGVSLTPGGAPFTGCTFDRPSVATSAAYMQITNNLADIEQCDFISSGTGHAIVITTAGEYAFVKNTFTGYATNAGTAGNRAIYNNSGGEVIINIDSGDTPSYTNGTSATTTINNTVTLTLTNIVNGSEVRILDAGTTNVRGGIEEVTGNQFAYGYSDSGSEVDIVVHKEEYIYYRINNFTLPGSSSSVPVAQQLDRQYYNPT